MTLVDDIGSFPLPSHVKKEDFNRAYQLARKGMLDGKNICGDEFVKQNFCRVTLDAFRLKLQSGLDVANYPQQYDGIRQVGDAIHRAMENGTFVVDDAEAFLPEVRLISMEAKALSEEFGGKKILLRVSLFGPMEQYLKEIGTAMYADVLEGFAETVRRFAKNSILDTKYVKTEVVSIDEPSFGFLNISAGNDVINEILERTFSFQGATRQIHLHSSARVHDLLSVKNLDVLSFEYAATPRNIESVSKNMFEAADKHIRIGVSRTDVDSIYAELHERGIAKPSADQLIEDEQVIRNRYVSAKKKFGDRMTFTGPDCGLGSWPSQDAAALLLTRTVKAVKSVPLAIDSI